MNVWAKILSWRNLLDGDLRLLSLWCFWLAHSILRLLGYLLWFSSFLADSEGSISANALHLLQTSDVDQTLDCRLDVCIYLKVIKIKEVLTLSKVMEIRNCKLEIRNKVKL